MDERDGRLRAGVEGKADMRHQHLLVHPRAGMDQRIIDKIAADTKVSAGAAQHQHAALGRRPCPRNLRREPVKHAAVISVALVRPVERERCDAALVGGGKHKLTGRSHGHSSLKIHVPG
ncbi:MAG: hypothetical protein WB820_17950 [Rhodoplanes sp.]